MPLDQSTRGSHGVGCCWPVVSAVAWHCACCGQRTQFDGIPRGVLTMVRNLRQFGLRVQLTVAAVFFATAIFPGELLTQSGGMGSGPVPTGNKLPVAQARVRVLDTDL